MTTNAPINIYNLRLSTILYVQNIMKQIVTMDASVLSKIPSELIRNGLRKVFSEKLQTENVKIGVESGSKNGDNFIGIVYRVTGEVIQSADERTDAANNLKLILKVAPQSLSRRERFFSRPCFLREIFIYNEVWTEFNYVSHAANNVFDYFMFFLVAKRRC